MRSIEEIEKIVCKIAFLNAPEVSFLSEGYGNYNYLVQEEGRKFVLRIKKSTETQFLDSLEKEYVFLKYFREQGIDFCPEVYFYDKEDNFLVESFLEGEEVRQKDFTDKQIDLFARQLHDLFTVKVQDFSAFCIANGCKDFDYVSPLVSLDTYGFKRLEKAKEDGLSHELYGWIENQLKINLSYIKTQDQVTTFRGFSWGDIQSRVILKNGKNMYFYDFEHASIANNFGLAYIKIHGSFSDTQFEYLVERCAFYFKKTAAELLIEILAEEKIIRVNDVVWAAMKWAETKDKKYETILQNRIKLVENLYKGTPFDVAA